MKDFAGKIAVLTGGGTGMGRELARQLVAEGCTVAMCDVNAHAMAETRRLCADHAPQGTRVVTHVADVSEEDQILAFVETVKRELETERVHLLFNNAGIGGGGSVVDGDRRQWDKTFAVCWFGVYYTTRAFMPLLVAAPEAHIVNTSSVNGFWASIGPGRPHSAYSAAKFAVRGFTEALITDLALNAPHVKCSVVMPGHIGTEIVANSREVLSTVGGGGAHALAEMRKMLAAQGLDPASLTDAQIEQLSQGIAARFRDEAPMTAAAAATVILDGVKADKWRILVGQDAHYLDERVRADPENAYSPAFYEALIANSNWRI